MTLPHTLPAWAQLQSLANAPQPHLRDVLSADAGRTEHMTLRAAGITGRY